MSVAVELPGRGLDGRGDLGLQHHRQHRPSAVTHDLIQQPPTGQLVGRLNVVNYLEHGCTFPNRRANADPIRTWLTASILPGRCTYFTSPHRAPSTASDHCPAAVERVGEARALGTESGSDGAFANAREPIGQKFAPVGGGEPIFVAVNHLKSKGSAGPWPGDADARDGQGASNESRVRQATALSEWITTVTDEGDAVALVGDFNSYTQEDPLQVLYEAGYVDAQEELNGTQYSYSFSGLSGSLDHVLLNDAALARATGEDTWEINAEESIALEYSRYNYHGKLYYAADHYRSSDHDPVVVGLSSSEVAPIDLDIVDINDFHGRIDNNTMAFAKTVEDLKTQNPDGTLFASAGDNIGASLFASSSQQDQPTIDVLNALGLQVSAMGNHEFDQGYDDLAGRVDDAADFPYLGANVYEKGTTTPALPA